MGKVVILVLAAGSSSRMRGRDKLLEPVDGIALLRRQTLAALSTGADVIVALPPGATARQEALEGLSVQTLSVADAAMGMGHSLAAGAQAAGDAEGLMVMPADMPGLTGENLTCLIKGFTTEPDRIWQGATADGRAGHPVIFPARLFDRLQALRGDRGARAVLETEDVALVTLPGDAAVLDLDTPEDWARFRAAP